MILLISAQVLAEWQSGYAAACKAVDLGSIPGSASKTSHQVILTHARVAELVDAADLKSAGLTAVPVQVRPWAPFWIHPVAVF